ncbi:MAG: Hsp20/alpha crystallin family protein [Treponema sp.]|nr:Hsp20/alpha crystallin family protein [Treponema sp.]
MNELALFNSLFDDFGDDSYTMPSFNYRKVFQTPRVDVKEEDNAYTLEMDLPGKTDKDVKIDLNHNVLTIASESENKDEKKEEKKNKNKWLIKERSFMKFSRSFTLPDDVNGEEISASCKNGVLKVIMPRTAKAETKHIAISYAG